MGTRRDFIRKSTFFAAGAAIAPSLASCCCNSKEIGLQIYTIRKQLNEDLEGSLRKIADIGYNSVEAAGYANGKFYNMAPREFTRVLKDMGLTLNSSHSVFTPEVADRVCEAHAEAGCKYIVYPYLPENQRRSIDDYKRSGEMLSQMAESANRHGLVFAYHNHDFEFIPMEGEIPMEVMLRNGSELIKMELDLYWIEKGGQDALKFFDKFPGRSELWHVKDMEDSQEKTFAPVGTGTINFEKIFAAREKAGMKKFFIEQDRYKGDIWEDITTSFNYLNSAKFV